MPCIRLPCECVVLTSVGACCKCCVVVCCRFGGDLSTTQGQQSPHGDRLQGTQELRAVCSSSTEMSTSLTGLEKEAQFTLSGSWRTSNAKEWELAGLRASKDSLLCSSAESLHSGSASPSPTGLRRGLSSAKGKTSTSGSVWEQTQAFTPS